MRGIYSTQERDSLNPAVSRIHLLKRMTLELREIQALRNDVSVVFVL